MAGPSLIGAEVRRTDHAVAPWPPAEAVDEMVLWAAPLAGVRKIVGGHLFIGERVMRIPDDPLGGAELTDLVFERLLPVLGPAQLRRPHVPTGGIAV